MSNGIGHVWAVNAEGGDEGRPNGVGPVWIENADQLGSKLPEPASGDAGKVLGVLNSNGDIGWVPDQEGMAQVQADWDQDDPSQVSYIANKPTIPTVDQAYSASSANAQSGVAVAQAIAAIPESNVTTSTKQFVVGVNGTGLPITVDCANASETASSGTIEVAGVAGRNNLMGMDGVFFAVNGIDPNNTVTITFPADLGNASATGGFMQNVAWYQGAPGAVTNLQAGLSLSPTNIDGNVLKAGTYTLTGTTPSFTPDGVGLFYTGGGDAATQIIADVTAAAPTLTLSTTASVVTGYTIKPSVIANPGSDAAGKVLTVTDAQGNFGWQPVPQELPPISTHAGEVLKVNSGATGVEWGAPETVTVDQTYNAASTNAQSGVAVAQAIAAIPSASYSAGDGINITSGRISVDHDDTLSSAYRYETENVTSVSETYKAGIEIIDGWLLDFVINDAEDPDATLKIHIPGNTFFSELNNLVAARVIIADTDEFDHNAYSPDATLSVTYDSQNYRYVIDEQDVEIKAFYQEWEPISGGLQGRATYLGFGFYTNGGPQVITPSYAAQVSSTTLTDPVVIDVPIPMANKLLSVANPLPTSTSSDANKVLTVDAEGAPAWGMLGSVASIQQVNALPPSPDANTLYLIPEA